MPRQDAATKIPSVRCAPGKTCNRTAHTNADRAVDAALNPNLARMESAAHDEERLLPHRRCNQGIAVF